MRKSRSKPKSSCETVIVHTREILRKLGSSDEVESRTMKLIELADEQGVLASCSLIGGAAGLIYIAGILFKKPVTLAEIAKVAGISSETVRKYKILLATELKSKKNWPSKT